MSKTVNTNKSKASQKGKGILLPIVLTFASSLLLFLLLMLYFTHPQRSAERRLDDIYKKLHDGAFDFIVLSQTKPYDSGSLDQMMNGFELKLEGDDVTDLVAAFTEECKACDFTGSSVETAGFWDMKVTIHDGDERYSFYVFDGGIYITEKYRRFNFTCDGNTLYLITERIKDITS